MDQMQEQFVPKDLSLKLKELGFNENVFGYYTGSEKYPFILDVRNLEGRIEQDMIKAPLWQQAFDWFRVKHKFDSWIERYTNDETCIFQIPAANFKRVQGYYANHESARIALLIKLIELVKKK